MHLLHEIAHLHRAAQLLAQYENKQWQQVIPGGEFPKLLKFHDTRDYVRRVLDEQILLTANREDYVNVQDLPANHEYFFYQDRMNHNVNVVASHAVVDQHQQRFNVDYRAEAKPNPVEALSSRTVDNVKIARTPGINQKTKQGSLEFQLR